MLQGQRECGRGRHAHGRSAGYGHPGHRYTNGRLHTYTALKRLNPWYDAIDFRDARTALTRVAAEFEGWASHLTVLIAESGTDPIFRLIYALPVGHRWERVPGLTLIGNEAHLMSPFAGEGANLALYDGAELTRAIIAAPDDNGTALTVYERDLFPRSAQIADAFTRNLVQIFGAGAPHSVVAMLAPKLP